MWAWLRLDRSALWLVPGLASLALFAWLLTLVESAHAGSAYAGYGGSISWPRWSGRGPWRMCGPTAAA